MKNAVGGAPALWASLQVECSVARFQWRERHRLGVEGAPHSIGPRIQIGLSLCIGYACDAPGSEWRGGAEPGTAEHAVLDRDQNPFDVPFAPSGAYIGAEPPVVRHRITRFPAKTPRHGSRWRTFSHEGVVRKLSSMFLTMLTNFRMGTAKVSVSDGT